jgi:hypothetical protein
MDCQEAINQLSIKKADIELCIGLVKQGNQYISKQSSPLLVAINEAIKALKKQVPKKVIKHEGLNETSCPGCRFVFGYCDYEGETFDYCYNCGQKLSWD